MKQVTDLRIQNQRDVMLDKTARIIRFAAQCRNWFSNVVSGQFNEKICTTIPQKSAGRCSHITERRRSTKKPPNTAKNTKQRCKINIKSAAKL